MLRARRGILTFAVPVPPRWLRDALRGTEYDPERRVLTIAFAPPGGLTRAALESFVERALTEAFPGAQPEAVVAAAGACEFHGSSLSVPLPLLDTVDAGLAERFSEALEQVLGREGWER